MKLSDLFSSGNLHSTETKATIEMQRFCQAIADGRLEARFNTANLTGEAQRFGNAINEMLDAIVQPLNVATDYIERISKGETPPKITENYNGNFSHVKNGLNIVIVGKLFQGEKGIGGVTILGDGEVAFIVGIPV